MNKKLADELRELLDRYDEWEKGREELYEMENNGMFPTSDDWGASDDDGVDLAHRFAEIAQQILNEATAEVTE